MINKEKKKKLLYYVYNSPHFSDLEKLMIKWNVLVIDDAFIEVENVPGTPVCTELSKVSYHYNFKTIMGQYFKLRIMYYGAKIAWQNFKAKIKDDKKRVY